MCSPLAPLSLLSAACMFMSVGPSTQAWNTSQGLCPWTSFLSNTSFPSFPSIFLFFHLSNKLSCVRCPLSARCYHGWWYTNKWTELLWTLPIRNLLVIQVIEKVRRHDVAWCAFGSVQKWWSCRFLTNTKLLCWYNSLKILKTLVMDSSSLNFSFSTKVSFWPACLTYLNLRF